jgi:hypothetical protein
LALRQIHHLRLRAAPGGGPFSIEPQLRLRAIGAHCIDRAQSLHPASGDAANTPRGEIMRAEIQNVVDEIKQSVGLLRRHL